MKANQLQELGWKPAFQSQLALDEMEGVLIARVSAHFGSQIHCLTSDGELSLPSALFQSCETVTVGGLGDS